jgi:hypothetical protein
VPERRVSDRPSGRSQGQRKAKVSTPGLEALLAAGNKASEHSKPIGHQSKLPPELQAPITTKIEQQLTELIRQFGAENVRNALTPLVTNCKFNDWLCLANAIDRLARKVQQHGVAPVTRTKSRSKVKSAKSR